MWGHSLRYFPPGGIFRAERNFLLFKDQLAESERQKTKENIIPRGKFCPVENNPKDQLAESERQKTKENIIPGGKSRQVENGPYDRYQEAIIPAQNLSECFPRLQRKNLVLKWAPNINYTQIYELSDCQTRP